MQNSNSHIQAQVKTIRYVYAWTCVCVCVCVLTLALGTSTGSLRTTSPSVRELTVICCSSSSLNCSFSLKLAASSK